MAEHGADDIPYGCGDNPHTHWACCLGAASRAGGGPSRDGRRLGLPLHEQETGAMPLVLRLGGAPRSPEREAAREALARRVEAGELRMDAHERALLTERRAAGHNRPEAGDERPFDALPDEVLEDEIYCLYRLADAEPLGPGHGVLEQAPPLAVAREAPDTVTAPAHPDGPGRCEGDPPVIGVIDEGLGVLNARFRRPDGVSTRFDALWLQGFHDPCARARDRLAEAGLPDRRATQAGAVLEAEDIDRWLARGARLDEAAVYRRLGRALHEPGAHRALDRGFSHGTHVADLAAGADPFAERLDPDVRRWPLLGVQLPPEAVDDTAGRYLQTFVIAGLRWILHRARRLGRGPVVVSISLGALAGPKDGTRAIEWVAAHELALFEALTGRPARVNWSYGNARLNRQVARFVSGEAPTPLDWRLQPDDRAASFLEIRPEGGRVDALTVEIGLPGGRVETLRAPEPSRPASLAVDGRLALRLYRAPVPSGEPGERAETPSLVLAAAPTLADGDAPRAPAGAVRVTVRWDGAPGALRIEVQRGDTAIGHRAGGRQSTLDHPLAHAYEDEAEGHTDPSPSPITRAGTDTAYAMPRDERVWTTGAARPGRRADRPRPTRYAAAGALDATLGPTVSAPAERGGALGGLLASGTLSGSVRASGGSSAATPCATRALATMLAGAGAGRTKAEEAAALVARHGAATRRGREGLKPGHPDRLERAAPPEPGDARRLGVGTVLGSTGRRQA